MMPSEINLAAKREIRTFPNLEKASLEAADLIEAAAGAAISDKGFFTLVLTGGQDVRLLYQYLGGAPYSSHQSWQNIHFFWGDERWVAADHQESNQAMARELMLDRVIAPHANLHPVPVELSSPEEAAAAYERELRAFFAPHPELTNGRYPCFDCILLGMGKDGHTASLFPDSPLLLEEERWVVAVTDPAGEPRVPRITMTLPVFNSGREVLFLTSGPEKKSILDRLSADSSAAAKQAPAARVQPEGGLRWFHADEAA
jgi:6-phosphogluconolactonase